MALPFFGQAAIVTAIGLGIDLALRRYKTKAGIFGASALIALMVATAAQPFDAVTFDVTNASEALTKDLRAASALMAGERNDTVTAEDLFANARAEYGTLINALYAKGYYAPVIHVFIDGREAANIAPLDAPKKITAIKVTVDPGPLFTFSRAAVTPLATDTRLPSGFVAGHTAESDLVVQSVTAGINGWRNLGFAQAAVKDQHVVADHDSATLSADITLAPGQKLRFGDLKIVGAERIREERVREIAGLPVGEVYSPQELRDAADRLRRSGVFKSVSLGEDDFITGQDQLGITANLVENKRRHFSFGAEVASTEGVGLTGEWMHRNLFGGGENLKIDGAISNIGVAQGGVDYLLGAMLERPATFNPDTTLTFGVGAGIIDDVDYDMNFVVVSTGLKHVFSSTLSGSASVSYLYAQTTDPGGVTTFQALALPLTMIWDTRDSTTDATKNGYVALDAKPFLGFGVTSSGARLFADLRGYKSVGAQKGLVFAGRMQVGSILGASLEGTPTDYLFYSGGGGTVRGQPYQSLGVYYLRDSAGELYQTGGRQLLVGSVEARLRVTETIGVVGFFDAGRVDANGFFTDEGNYQAGAGLGLRYATPVGPLRVDVAMPVAGDTGEGVQIYIGLGQAF